MFRNCLLIFAVIGILTQFSYSEQAFKNYIPNGNKFQCLNCHTSTDGGKSWNKFGQVVRSTYMVAGKPAWGPALAKLDSDGDGITNGQELGDPEGTWKIGNAAPGVLANVTNPGDATSFLGVEDIISALEFININSVYPNPVKMNSKVDFIVKESGKVNVDILDLNGNLVSNLSTQYFDAGNFQLSIPTDNLANGTYFLRFSYGKYPLYQKIIVSN